jgi:uncharacterized membrane protein
MSRPFVWLSDGWDDLMHHRGASLAYGWLVSALGALILAYMQHPYFLAVFTTGFLLVGPILGAGLCELSRCQDTGQVANFETSLRPLSHNRKSLLALAERLMLIAILWFAVAAALLFSAVGNIAPSVESTVWGDVMIRLSETQLIAYTAIAVSLSAVVFALSVVSVPMIVDRHVDAGTAMRMSLRVTARDLPAMLVWAGLISILVFVGFTTWMVGLVVIYPWLGHATWRAYRELVAQ